MQRALRYDINNMGILCVHAGGWQEGGLTSYKQHRDACSRPNKL